jgi:Tfp pilus assembly protein PilF
MDSGLLYFRDRVLSLKPVMGGICVEGCRLYEIEYIPKNRLADMKIKMYFDPDTFHHARTEYRMRIRDDMSASPGDPSSGRPPGDLCVDNNCSQACNDAILISQGGIMPYRMRFIGFATPALLFIGLLLTSIMPAVAQNRILLGKVTDDKGQPVADAQILIQALEATQNLSTKTDKKGQYKYLLGAPGTYRIIVRKAGFQPQYKETRPALGEETEVDFQLVQGQDIKFPFEMTDAEKEQARQLASQSEKRKQFSTEVKAHFDLGVQMSEQGKYAEAVDEFGKALEKDPKQPGILSRQAEAYAKLGKNEEALSAYEKAIALNPNDAESLTNMGVVLNKLGKVSESQDAFKKAAAIPGASAQSLYNLGATLFNAQQTDEAAESFKKAIAMDPSFAEAYFQLGICLSGKPDTMPGAVEAFKKYIAIGKKPDQIDLAKQMIQAMGGK